MVSFPCFWASWVWAAIVGGNRHHRGSTTTGKRAVGAALTAVGAVMLLALGILVPVSSSTS